MKLFISVVAAAALIVMQTKATAIPVNRFRLITSRDDGVAKPKLNDHILDNLSYLFGWQMARAMITYDTQTAAACADISSIGHGKWAAMGLNPEYIQNPICTSSDSNPDPNPQTSITNIIHYTSQIFITQILESFDDDALHYMCAQVDFFLLDKFMLNSTGIIGAICHSVGRPLPPRPFSPGHEGPGRNAAAEAVMNYASTLYALMLATGMTTDTELDALCAQAPKYIDNLNAGLMNGTVFQDTACSIKDPISVDEAVNDIFTWVTRIFITMVENISNVDGWLDWLCDHVNTDLLNAVTLNGEVVKQQICEDSNPS